MSQRLHIGPTLQGGFDCILTTEEGAAEKLRADWLHIMGEMFLGPWNIHIDDLTLFRRVEPIIRQTLDDVGEEYPQCIWGFYFRYPTSEHMIHHPTQEQLDRWIDSLWVNHD